MIVATHQRRTRQGLNFGNRAREEIAEATTLSGILYRFLPDRERCIICSSDLNKKIYLINPGEIQERRNVFHPSCSANCRRKYLEWLSKE
ncbi:MAG: hypothetical protein NOU37_08270 [Candidatus Brocadiales bacterium]|nr:hypothetical protein [Candidatus Bathyanammoxibius amoris]